KLYKKLLARGVKIVFLTERLLGLKNVTATNLKLVGSGRRSNDSVINEIRDLFNSTDWEANLSLIPGDQNSVVDRHAHKAH
ncbi:hypothetical protein RYX36_020171, partial [Vicia faba]